MNIPIFKGIIKIIKTTHEGILSDSGFSLVEIIFATAISSVVLLMIYSAHRSISFAIQELTGVADFYENLNLTISRIDRDISCSYFKRDNKKLCFIGESGYDTPGEGKLNFVTVDHKAFSILVDSKVEYHLSDIHEVGYFLEEDKEVPGLFLLMRREENHYDDDPEAGGEKSIVLENVVDLQFEFKRRRNWTNKWDSREHNKFPKSVKTTLKVRNYRGNEEEFVFISYINLKK